MVLEASITRLESMTCSGKEMHNVTDVSSAKQVFTANCHVSTNSLNGSAKCRMHNCDSNDATNGNGCNDTDSLGSLPDNWEKAYTESGEVYFIDHATSTSHWLDPRLSKFQKKSLEDCLDDELPYGWEKIVDPNYGTFFIDHVNRRTQYENPVLEAKRVACRTRISCTLSFTKDPSNLTGQIFRTTLVKSCRGLGFTIVGGDDGSEEFLQINSVVRNGPAWLDGNLQTGDVIVYVNDICVLGYSHLQIVQLFQSINVGSTVNLELCRGYPLPFDLNDPNTEVVTTIAVDSNEIDRISSSIHNPTLLNSSLEFLNSDNDANAEKVVNKINQNEMLDKAHDHSSNTEHAQKDSNTTIDRNVKSCNDSDINKTAEIDRAYDGKMHKSEHTTQTCVSQSGFVSNPYHPGSYTMQRTSAQRFQQPRFERHAYHCSCNYCVTYAERDNAHLYDSNNGKHCNGTQRAVGDVFWQRLSQDSDHITTMVTLHRQENGFGFRIVGGIEDKSQVAVGHIVTGGAADLDRRICSGDQIVSVDGHSVLHASHRQVVELMSDAASRGYVTLVLRRRVRRSGEPPAYLYGESTNNQQPCDTIYTYKSSVNYQHLPPLAQYIPPPSPPPPINYMNHVVARNTLSNSYGGVFSVRNTNSSSLDANDNHIFVQQDLFDNMNSINNSNTSAPGKLHEGAYDVSVERNDNEGFGFVIISSASKQGSTIGRLIEGSPAEKCGKLHVGDFILAVNRIPITHLGHGEIVNLIKESGLTVTLTISRS